MRYVWLQVQIGTEQCAETVCKRQERSVILEIRLQETVVLRFVYGKERRLVLVPQSLIVVGMPPLKLVKNVMIIILLQETVVLQFV